MAWIKLNDRRPKDEGYYNVKFGDGTRDEKPYRITPSKNIDGFMTKGIVSEWWEPSMSEKALRDILDICTENETSPEMVRKIEIICENYLTGEKAPVPDEQGKVGESKPFIVANVREITDLFGKEEISYSRMVEMLNEIASKFYTSSPLPVEGKTAEEIWESWLAKDTGWTEAALGAMEEYSSLSSQAGKERDSTIVDQKKEIELLKSFCKKKDDIIEDLKRSAKIYLSQTEARINNLKKRNSID